MATGPSSVPRAVILLAALTCGACAARSDEAGAAASASPLIVEGSPEALGVLGLLNAPTTTHTFLDDDVGLDRRAADNLIAHRDGTDGVVGTADDDPFDDVAEVDAVSWVGPSALDKLLAHARAGGWVPSGDDVLGVYDGVSFTVDEGLRVISFVNEASASVLDVDVGLDRRAVESILAARPLSSVERLSELYYVGRSALERLKELAPNEREIAIISDLDRTVIPVHSGGLPSAPYPGVAALYTELDLGAGGTPGDMFYVTAREPEALTGIEAWLESHGVPAGPIEPGVSGVPWFARPEKVADITAILDARSDQSFVLFGDSNHVDPEVMADVLAAHPDRISAALLHDVSGIDPADVPPGIRLYAHYAEAAAVLLELGLVDEAAARRAMGSARAEGLSITQAEIDQLVADALAGG